MVHLAWQSLNKSFGCCLYCGRCCILSFSLSLSLSLCPSLPVVGCDVDLFKDLVLTTKKLPKSSPSVTPPSLLPFSVQSCYLWLLVATCVRCVGPTNRNIMAIPTLFSVQNDLFGVKLRFTNNTHTHVGPY